MASWSSTGVRIPPPARVLPTAESGSGRGNACPRCSAAPTFSKISLGNSAGQFLQELLLIQPVLECFAAVDEDDRDFVGELAAQLVIGLHVHFAPAEAAPALQFGELFFYDFAKMAPLT